jgi:hypothetical protein
VPSQRALTLPADFIGRPPYLAWIERLIAGADDFVEVTVDFESGRTVLKCPVLSVDPSPMPRRFLT